MLHHRDHLDDEARRRWFGHIVREWRRITRTVYRLES
jgi:hypothetical protein